MNLLDILDLDLIDLDMGATDKDGVLKQLSSMLYKKGNILLKAKSTNDNDLSAVFIVPIIYKLSGTVNESLEYGSLTLSLFLLSETLDLICLMI